MRKIVFALLIVLVVIGFLFGVMNAQTNGVEVVSFDTNSNSIDVSNATPTPVSIWTLNPMEILCDHSQSMVGTVMCINALISHIVIHRQTQVPTPTPIPTPVDEPRLQKLTDVANEIVYCVGDCIARVEIHFPHINVFQCPNDESVSLYFYDQLSTYKGYLTGESLVDWRVTANKTVVYTTMHLIQELGEAAQIPQNYTLNLYCQPPRNN